MVSCRIVEWVPMKVSCQATCQKCYHERGRRHDLDVNDLVWHCNSCNKIYLCEIGLAKLGDNYSCPFDHAIVIKEEVDKSMIKKEGIPGSTGQSTAEMYHKLRGKGKEDKKKTKDTESLSAIRRSKISELNDIDQLTIPLLLELTKIPLFKIKMSRKVRKSKTRKELLERLGQENGELIDFLYSALFKLENTPYALATRFAVYIPFILSNIAKVEVEIAQSSTINLTLINSVGAETIVYCRNTDIDVKDLDKLANEVFAVDFKNHPKVKIIFLVANSFSYMAKGMIKKYESALTAINESPDKETTDLFKSIPISLWQPIPGKLGFQNVTL